MEQVGYRYAQVDVAAGADDLIAASAQARSFLPADAPVYAWETVEKYAYQGQAGLRARDMSGAELELFEQDLWLRYRDDDAALPDDFDDFLWISEQCPTRSRAAGYGKTPDDLIIGNTISIVEPLDTVEIVAKGMEIAFQGDPTLPNDGSSRGYKAEYVETDGSTAALTIRPQNTRPVEELEFGLCDAAGARFDPPKVYVLYLEPTNNGTTIVIGFNPQASDLAPGIFTIWLVSSDHAPMSLGQAGFCEDDFGVWQPGAESRILVRVRFDAPPFVADPEVTLRRGFFSIDEMMATPGAAAHLHSLRSMTFGFMEDS